MQQELSFRPLPVMLEHRLPTEARLWGLPSPNVPSTWLPVSKDLTVFCILPSLKMPYDLSLNNSSHEVTALWRHSLSLFLSVGQRHAGIYGQHVGYACWIIKVDILGVLLSKCVFVPNLICFVSICLCTCALVCPYVCVHGLSWKPEGNLQEWILFFCLGSRSWVHVIGLLWQVFLPTESSFQAHTYKFLSGTLLTNYFKNLSDSK